MRSLYLFLLAVLISASTFGQGPRVPGTMEFAGIKLQINEKARNEIQADVDNIRRSEKYFQKRVEKIDLHFPIIERIFKEEKLPDDFKYLVIQESALVSDAVSSSNAVGFWQFKKETGLEVGLRIDNIVDERLNLASSSRGAAKYMKKNNFYFDNWLYALLAYNTGRGGAEKYISDKDFGKTKMNITGSTHWYVKKFLAHKIAYQDEIGKGKDQPFFLFEYLNGGGKSLNDIAREYEIEKELFDEYNKCFKKGKVPEDKVYSVLIPIGFDKANLIAKNNDGIYGADGKSTKNVTKQSIFSVGKNGSQVKSYYSAAGQFPKIKKTESADIFEINNNKGTIAKAGDNFDVLAIKGGITLDKFLEYNDLTKYDKIQSGQVYYFESKGTKAKTHYHTLAPGQTLWEVSQKYGVRLNKLLTKNRLEDEGGVKAGLVLWLRYIRPKSVSPEYHDIRHLKNGQEQVVARENVKKEVAIATDMFFEDENPTVMVPQKDADHIEVFVDSEEGRAERKKILATDVEEMQDPRIIGYKNIEHTVQKGDTYFSISNLYKIDISDLLEWNNRKINDVLSIGQVLKIKLPQYQEEQLMAKTDISPKETSGVLFHKVSESDTLYGISKKYEVTIKDIMEWNGKEDFIIKPGEELKIILK